MRPVTLRFKGLNSFEEETFIDFKKLSSRGIFGIFGPTGSGKSTILDAVTLALYGDTARKSTNFINLASDRMYVEYTFSMTERGEEILYTVRREFKRTKQGGIGTVSASVTRTEDGSTDMIAEKKNEVDACCQEILGLKFEDFIRTVLLPQGKFSEFLKLKGSERRDMLERLFHLEKYGGRLQEKLRAAKMSLTVELAELSGQMGSMGETGEELIQSLEEQVHTLTQEKQRRQEEYEGLRSKTEQDRVFLALLAEWRLEEEKLRIMEGKTEEIRVLREKVKKAKAAELVMPYIQTCLQSQVQHGEKEREYTFLEEQVQKLRFETQQVEEEYGKAEEGYRSMLPRLRADREKVERILAENKEVTELEYELGQLNQVLLVAQKKREEGRKELTLLKTEIQEGEREISRLYQSIIETFEERENISPEEKFRKSVDYVKRHRNSLEPCPVCGGFCSGGAEEGAEEEEEVQEEELDTRISRIQQQQRQAAKLKKETDSRKDRQKICEKEMEDAEAFLSEREKEKVGLMKTKEEKLREIKKQELDISLKAEFSECHSYEEFLCRLVNETAKIESDYAALSERRERTVREREKRELELKECEGACHSLLQAEKKAETEMEAVLREKGIDRQTAEEMYLEEPERKRMETDIRKFDERFAGQKGVFETISRKLGGRQLTAEKQDILSREHERETLRMQDLRQELDYGAEVLTVRRQKLAAAKENFIKRKELEKKQGECEHRQALLSDLESLFKGKKFVEYAAYHRLRYITGEACARLKQITGGAYELVLDENSQFAIRDLKCGGELRDASTLSGGETFMTSLALALALSAEIQLKGKAPLELFFMDEGFGSLDEELLDVVMNSLEKIHHEHMKVGIISHVELIKNRIPSRLLVIPAKPGEGGSRIAQETG